MLEDDIKKTLKWDRRTRISFSIQWQAAVNTDDCHKISSFRSMGGVMRLLTSQERRCWRDIHNFIYRSIFDGFSLTVGHYEQ